MFNPANRRSDLVAALDLFEPRRVDLKLSFENLFLDMAALGKTVCHFGIRSM
jgi:hypothetical protein